MERDEECGRRGWYWRTLVVGAGIVLVFSEPAAAACCACIGDGCAFPSCVGADPSGMCPTVICLTPCTNYDDPTGSCSGNTCNPPGGGCCTDSGCTTGTEAACSAAGGVYRGDGTACTGVVCQASGTPCTSASQCASGFCADGVCCDMACTGPLQSCDLAGQVGTCGSTAAAAPALSGPAWLVALLLLVGIGGTAFVRRRTRMPAR